MARYKKILYPFQVSPEALGTAELAAIDAAGILRIQTPPIFFVKPDPEGSIELRNEVYGWSNIVPEIWLNLDQPLKNLAATIFHESHHVSEFNTGDAFSVDNETRARTFAELFVRDLPSDAQSLLKCLEWRTHGSHARKPEFQWDWLHKRPDAQTKQEPQHSKWPSGWSALSIKQAERLDRGLRDRTKYWLDQL
jgi:hypothetical protein